MKIKTLLVAAITVALVGPAATIPASASSFADGCEITLTVPARLAVDRPAQTFTIDMGEPHPCMGSLTTQYGSWGMMRSDQAYQARATFGTFDRHDLYSPVPKKVSLAASYARLDAQWARANGVAINLSIPRVNPSNTMDVRYRSWVTKPSVKRTLGEVKVTGTATRYQLPGYTDPTDSPGKRVGNAGAVVQVQKKVGAAWVTKKRVKTTKSGAFSATVKDTGAGAWRAVVNDSHVAFGTTSSDARVAKAKAAATKISKLKAKRSGKKVTVTAKVTAKSGKRYVAARGVKVQLQSKAGKKWRTVRTARTTSSGKVTLRVNARATTQYRVVVPKQSVVKAKSSKVFRR
ncbi:hypothetical protein GCM10011331_18780 [Flavimobilis marinus]|uniref:Uncharacterized protein n=1 Tax=Flavimobilis marinus TaxID=285351 RepID=A0A1I2F425_9MICO|nr:hypothetical protein [Flavimobilis marinus]GHG53320.1 hypothetical protein GCM10011331_18780 [Flavimobilis marinus]SFE99271.1 hypothetical protein SAMN04488035_1076 [Flavimobilis marinus]